MKILCPSVEILTSIEDIVSQMKIAELAGRNCYKSENLVTKESYKVFLGNMAERKHLSIFEHVNISIRLITNRAVTHQLVRHRTGIVYSQESQRYCNYSQGKFDNSISYIPSYGLENDKDYLLLLEENEKSYFNLLEKTKKSEVARGILSNDAKTDIVFTVNLRQLLHILDMRAFEQGAQNDIREIFLNIFIFLFEHFQFIISRYFEMVNCEKYIDRIVEAKDSSVIVPTEEMKKFQRRISYNGHYIRKNFDFRLKSRDNDYEVVSSKFDGF